MLVQQTIELLMKLRLRAMAEELERQRTTAAMQSLSAEERIGMMVDAEFRSRDRRRMNSMIKKSDLKILASPEDINYRTTRGLDRQLVTLLLTCDWIEKSLNVFITGATGLGKTWLACALGHQAMRKGHVVLYKRFPKLIRELEVAHGDGSIAQLRNQLTKADLLILDDWGLAAITPLVRHELMELIDDRSSSGALLVTSQLPVAQWHDYIGEPTIADAIIDRIIHNAHRLELTGPSMRSDRSKDSAVKGDVP